MTGHGGGDDERTGFTFFEVGTDGFGAVVYAIQIDVDDVFPGFDGGVEDSVVGGFAGVGDEDVDFAEIFEDVGDELFHALAKEKEG